MINIFWDLDGTLVDSRYRLYKLFCDLVDISWLRFEQYWDYKRQGYNQRQMLQEVVHYNHESLETFNKLWLENIEDVNRLGEDVLKNGAREILNQLYLKNNKMYIVTNRQSYENTVKQLDWLGILDYFEGVYNTAQKCKKSEIVLRDILVKKGDMFIGDSYEDVMAAKELGITSILIKEDNHSGITYDNKLQSYVVYDYTDIQELLNYIEI